MCIYVCSLFIFKYPVKILQKIKKNYSRSSGKVTSVLSVAKYGIYLKSLTFSSQCYYLVP